MALVIDERNKFRGYNVVALVQNQPLKSAFCDIEGAKKVSVGVSVKPKNDRARVKVAVFFSDNNFASLDVKVKIFDITSDDFVRVTYEDIDVVKGAMKARLVVVPVEGEVSVGLCKLEIGSVATEFSSNSQSHLTMITAKGVYTGEIHAKQIIVGDGTLDKEWTKLGQNFIGLGNRMDREFATLRADQLEFSKGLYTSVDEKITQVSEGVGTIMRGFQSTLDANGLKITELERGVGTAIEGVRTETDRKIKGVSDRFSQVETAVTNIGAGKITLRNKTKKVKITTEDNTGGAVILVGGDTYSSAKFAVDDKGIMKAKGGTFEGDIRVSTINMGSTSSIPLSDGMSAGFIVDKNGQFGALNANLLTPHLYNPRIWGSDGRSANQWLWDYGTLHSSKSNGTSYMQSCSNGEYWWGVFNTGNSAWSTYDSSTLISGLDTNGIWKATSDIRLKENLKEITDDEAINIIKGLQIYQFNYKSKKDSTHVGVVAQDLLKVAHDKENVLWDKSEYYTVRYQALGLVAQQATKALINKVESLEERLRKLEEKLAD